MEPFEQEERRQAEWDRRCDSTPRCSHCGGSLYPYDTYTEIGDAIYCEMCVSRGTHFVDNLEV